jgi:hypothetical protein
MIGQNNVSFFPATFAGFLKVFGLIGHGKGHGSEISVIRRQWSG